MENIEQSLLGLGQFSLYFVAALILLLIFKFVYAVITPHDEWKLVKEDQNIAAAIGFTGAIIGFAIALSSAINHSISLIDFIIWAAIALVAQCIAFAIVRFVFLPQVVRRIREKETSAGIILAGTCIAVGLINAACMSY